MDGVAERLTDALDAAGVGVWEHSPQDGTCTWSAALFRLLALPPATVRPAWEALMSAFHPDDGAEVARRIAATDDGEGFELDVRVKRLGGERWAHQRVQVSRDAEGRVARVLGWMTDITPRKRAELRARRLALIAPRSDNLVVLTGPDARIEWVNEAFSARTGFTLDEAVGHKPGALLQGPSTSPEAILAMRAAIAERDIYRGDVVNYTKDGVPYWVSVYIQPIVHADGEFSGFMSISSDVTARRLADQARDLDRAVAATLLRATSFAEAAPEILRNITRILRVAAAQVWRVEPGEPALVYVAGHGEGAAATAFVELSRSIAFTSGESPAEVGTGAPGAAWGTRRASVLRELPAHSRRAAAARAAGIVPLVAIPILGADTVIGVLELAGTALYPGHELMPETLERACVRIAEFELRASEHRRFEAEQERLRSLQIQHSTIERLIVFSPIPLLLVSSAGRIRLVNAVASVLLDRPPEQLLGAAITSLLPEWDTIAGAGLREGAVHEVVVRASDGRELHADLHASHFEDGVERSVLVALIDQSERKRAERTITQARDAAEMATLAKSRFLANMSHEIRTPLNVILGISRLALGKPMAEEPRRYLRHVHDEAVGLLGIISDILDISKVEAGQMKVERVEFALGEVVRGAIERFGLKAREKSILLGFAEEGSLPEGVVGDPLRLSQILNNVLGNALKFTEHGEVHLTMRATPVEAGSSRLTCVVRDTGIGMSPETVNQLFQAFMQADASTTRKYGGTGLGLSICKQLCELMGGIISVESALGRGTTVRIELPFEVPIAAPRVAPAPAGPGAALRGARVLVVDDHPLNIAIVKDVLELSDVTVTTAFNGQEAIARVERDPAGPDGRPYDVVFMDVQMPVMDGLTAARRIRALADPARAAIPIVAMTANAMSEDAAKSVAAGMNEHLTKPIDFDELRRSVLRWSARQE